MLWLIGYLIALPNEKHALAVEWFRMDLDTWSACVVYDFIDFFYLLTILSIYSGICIWMEAIKDRGFENKNNHANFASDCDK